MTVTATIQRPGESGAELKLSAADLNCWHIMQRPMGRFIVIPHMGDGERGTIAVNPVSPGKACATGQAHFELLLHSLCTDLVNNKAVKIQAVPLSTAIIESPKQDGKTDTVESSSNQWVFFQHHHDHFHLHQAFSTKEGLIGVVRPEPDQMKVGEVYSVYEEMLHRLGSDLVQGKVQAIKVYTLSDKGIDEFVKTAGPLWLVAAGDIAEAKQTPIIL
jgi:hypothetical protein